MVRTSIKIGKMEFFSPLFKKWTVTLKQRFKYFKIIIGKFIKY